jgi:hypothetical protein
MLTHTDYTISNEELQEAVNNLPSVDTRLVLNEPTGDFFYDPWELKSEFKNTIWQIVLDSLPKSKGEARLIKLEPGDCYPSHADVDDRWHLSISGNNSYLIDLENQQMYQTNDLGRWYLMDAGIRHTAANFGSESRVQLVVRKLLSRNQLQQPVKISIRLNEVIGERRFIFDDIISPWINRAYKSGSINDFKGSDLEATMIIEHSILDDLINISAGYFTISIVSQ